MKKSFDAAVELAEQHHLELGRLKAKVRSEVQF
jgi:hypothetical protein